MGLLTVSPSPHDHTTGTVSKLMYGVIIALLPAFLVSVLFFGIGTIIITSIAVLSCLIFEYLKKFIDVQETPRKQVGFKRENER